jgi:ribosomal protein L7Ae-like RNA K-turn-binding protein
MDEVSLIVAATDLDSGESLRTLGRIKRAHKPLSQTFAAKELGKALGHSEIKFLGIIGKKAAMSYLLKLKKGETDEKTAVQ